MRKKTLIGYAFVCPECKETMSGTDLTVKKGKLEYCKLCGSHCLAVGIYDEDIEKTKSNKGGENA